jgi:glutathione S-transferase
MLELYHNDMSTCAQKVRLVLAEKGLDWTNHHFKLRDGPQHSPEYLKLNPNGVVPTLIDRGAPIIESTVICEYLDDTYPSPPLKPADTLRRAKMRLWTKKLDEGLHAHLGTISICIAFRHQYLEKGFDAQLNSVPDPVRRERRRTNIVEGVSSPYFREAAQTWHKTFAAMNADLEDRDCLADGGCSLADLAYVPYFNRFEQLQILDLLCPFPAVSALYERLKARGSYKTAIVDWLNADYLALMDRTGLEVRDRVAEIVAPN